MKYLVEAYTEKGHKDTSNHRPIVRDSDSSEYGPCKTASEQPSRGGGLQVDNGERNNT